MNLRPLARTASARLVLALCSLPLLAVLLASPAPARATEASPAVPARIYITVAGDTLDRVVHKTLAHSPLKAELLRQALVQANPKVLPATGNPRLKPGTELYLPDHEALLRRTLEPLLKPADAQANADTAPDRRRWVRFP